MCERISKTFHKKDETSYSVITRERSIPQAKAVKAGVIEREDPRVDEKEELRKRREMFLKSLENPSEVPKK